MRAGRGTPDDDSIRINSEPRPLQTQEAHGGFRVLDGGRERRFAAHAMLDRRHHSNTYNDWGLDRVYSLPDAWSQAQTRSSRLVTAAMPRADVATLH